LSKAKKLLFKETKYLFGKIKNLTKKSVLTKTVNLIFLCLRSLPKKYKSISLLKQLKSRTISIWCSFRSVKERTASSYWDGKTTGLNIESYLIFLAINNNNHNQLNELINSHDFIRTS